MPYWAHAGYDVCRWHVNATPDLAGGFVGEGGRYLFLNRYARHEAPGYWLSTPLTPVIVDLRTGGARELGGPEARFNFAGTWRWYELIGMPLRYVTLAEGVSMMTNIVDCDLDKIRIGQAVRVVWKKTEDGPPVPMFTPA